MRRLAGLRIVRVWDLAAAGGLFVLLTWLLLGGLPHADRKTAIAIRSLDRYEATQSQFQSDVLRARAGILRDYTPLGGQLAAMRNALETVRANLDDPAAANLLRPIVVGEARQEALTARFIAENIELQKLLAGVRLLTERQLNQELMSLAPVPRPLSEGRPNRSPNSAHGPVDQLGSIVGRVETTCARRDCPPDVGKLISHHRFLHSLLPKVDGVVSELVGTNRGRAIARLGDHLRAREAAAEAGSVRFRLLMYGISVLLLLLLLRREAQLRARAAELRQQLQLEHAVAALCTHLIGSGDDMLARVRAGLEQIARVLGANRAYFSARELQDICVWSGSGNDNGDLAAAVRSAWDFAPDNGGVVQLGLRHRTARLGERALLRALSAKSWIGIFRGSEGEHGGLLGFDFPRRVDRHSSGQLAVLHTAFHAVCLAAEQAAVERERRRLADRLARARRMEAIGTFTSGIAHNLNNILGAIGGFAEMAQAELADAESPAQFVQQIQLAAGRGHGLVEGLLDYGRRREYRGEWVDLDELVYETATMADATLSALHSVALSPGMNGQLIMTDAGQLQQVLLNIGCNAAQAMPEGGTVRVETTFVTLTEALDHPHGKVSPGRYAVVTISDEGGGIPRARLHRLFEPFYTTKPDGNGLGLSTAQEIVRGLGGVITLDSEEGIGTSARVWLPLQGPDGGDPAQGVC